MIYCLLYYRGLGLVVVASLIIAGIVTYGVVLVLAKSAGFTLTLPGIAGLIVAVGITADSFIVYFERIRDEMREGRSMRVAVETGWARARNTCLAADAVSLLAAVVLYIFAIGVVRGFAFALGVSTIIDVAVFFWFTKPMMTMLARLHVLQQRQPVLRSRRARRSASTKDRTCTSLEGGPDGQAQQARKRPLRRRRLDRLRRPQVALVHHLRRSSWCSPSAGSTSRASTSASSSRAASSTTSASPPARPPRPTWTRSRTAVADTGIDAAASPIVNTSGETIRVQTEAADQRRGQPGHRRDRRGGQRRRPERHLGHRTSARAGVSRSPSAP